MYLGYKNNLAKELDAGMKHMVVFKESNIITISNCTKIFTPHQN